MTTLKTSVLSTMQTLNNVTIGPFSSDATSPIHGMLTMITEMMIVLDPLTASPDDVAAALRRVLDEPWFTAAARRVREEILALPSAADAVSAL